MRRLFQSLRILAAALLLGTVAPVAALSASASSAAAGTEACSIEQVSVRTSDGIVLDGILYRPLAHPRPTAFLLVHGFGGNFYRGYFPVFARAAAERGYPSLALNMRDHDNTPKPFDFADNETDIAAGAAYLRGLGFSRLVLLGQSMGTNRVLYYVAATGDRSILATVLVSGPGNLFEWNVWQFGRQKAQATVNEALALQAAGKEQQFMVVDLGPLGKALYTARYLLSLRGPNARSDPYENLRKVKNPILIVQGTADRLIEPGIGERLRRAATSGQKVDLVYIEGADHSFRNQEVVLAMRILGWLEKLAS